MKTIVKLFLTLLMIATMSSSVLAQATNSDELLKRRVKERVALMNSYISYMANKKKAYDTRTYYRKKALPLFIGNGYRYMMDGEGHEGVLMQTTSTNTKNVTSTLMRDYFQNLINLSYSDVQVTSTSAADMKISDLKKIGPNKYVCTCQYVQYFYGYRDGKLVYRDSTTKRIECLIEEEEIEEDLNGNKVEYTIKLGDVEALHTERI